MRHLVSLNDTHWFVGAVAPQPFPAQYDFPRVEGWLPATVPGDVRLDLLSANKILDPFLGTNNEASQWVDDYDWWYRRDVHLEAAQGMRSFLIFEGVDYQSAVYWNDQKLGEHVGMFSRQMYEIPSAWTHDDTNRLALRVSGGGQLSRPQLNIRERLWRAGASRIIPHAAHAPEFPDRYATLKCQMSFGWDFAPRLLTCGIWDEVWLARTRGVFIRSTWIQGVPDGRVRVTLDLDTPESRTLQVRFDVCPRNFDTPVQRFEFPLEAVRGSVHSFSFQIESPRVWNPWDRGAPHLYCLQTTILDEQGEMDFEETTFGLRTIELEQSPDAANESAPWSFVVNSETEFIRGANWVPADAFPARVTRADYAELLGMAREANINMLRVWGGGVKEKRSFYELCDELGILVWQEFPFSGAGVDYFPRDKGYGVLVEQECQAIVRALRNHPSVVLWCGGNEFIPSANRHLIELMREAVAYHDGTRPFKPASPSQDESHNWRVWHGLANTRDYQNDAALFLGEFGMQAVPNVETLNRFLPDEGMFPPNMVWEYHNAEIEKLWRYADPILAAQAVQEVTLAQFVDATQEAQLRGLQIAIEHARRSKPRVSGCAFWQFNEPWYSICWSVVDYARTPKRAYAKIKELYNPVLVSFAYPLRQRAAGEIVSGQVWIVNDRLSEVRGGVSVWHNDGLVMTLDVSIAANTAQQVESLDLLLAPGANKLHLELRGDDFVGTNEYDLNYCDKGEISPRRAFLTNAAAWLRAST